MRDKKYKLTLSDIWYYYKVHFFVAVAIILAIVYTVYTAVTNVEPDFTIDCISDSGVTYESEDLLKQLLETGGAVADNNGDGEVKVNISATPSGMSGTTADPNYVEIVQLRMAVGESAIILTEPKVISSYEQHGIFMDLTQLADDCGIAESDRIISSEGYVIGIKIDNCGLFATNGITTKDLYLTLRTPSSNMQKKEEMIKQFDNASAVAQYIIKGN
ncbi:MAG: hypothetical protein IJ365_04135 [Clostridia bacterium]|nr:hypothetical protein [Clostridia bacterium]